MLSACLVSAETRCEAAVRAGYVPNQSGRSLRSGRTGIVAAVIPTRTFASTTDSGLFDILEGARRTLRQHALELVVLFRGPEEDPLENLQRTVQRRICDAVIISQTTARDPRLAYLKACGMDYVAFGRSSGIDDYPFVDFDFGSAVAIDGFVNVTRESNTANSKVANSRLIFDTDGIAGFEAATDTVVNFTPATTGERGQGFINRFPKVTARKVRWQVLSTVAGSDGNTGAMEMRFLRAPAGAAPVAGVAAVAGSPALDATLALAHASNGVAGRTLPGVAALDDAP